MRNNIQRYFLITSIYTIEKQAPFHQLLSLLFQHFLLTNQTNQILHGYMHHYYFLMLEEDKTFLSNQSKLIKYKNYHLPLNQVMLYSLNIHAVLFDTSSLDYKDYSLIALAQLSTSL